MSAETFRSESEEPVFEGTPAPEERSESSGIEERLREDLNRFAFLEHEMRRAEDDLEKIAGKPDDERAKPYNQRKKADAEDFLTYAKLEHEGLTGAGVVRYAADAVRALPEGEELARTVHLNDAVAEFESNPQSREAKEFLDRAVGRQEKFAAKLSALGIDREAAWKIYDRFLADNTRELREQVAMVSERERKIAEAKTYFKEQAIREGGDAQEGGTIELSDEIVEALLALGGNEGAGLPHPKEIHSEPKTQEPPEEIEAVMAPADDVPTGVPVGVTEKEIDWDNVTLAPMEPVRGKSAPNFAEVAVVPGIAALLEELSLEDQKKAAVRYGELKKKEGNTLSPVSAGVEVALQKPPTPLREGVTHGVAREFETRLGVSEGVLFETPGFAELSPGQQLLVLRNMETLLAGDVKKEAAAKQKEEWQNLPAWKRIGRNIFTFGMEADLRTAELEKEIVATKLGRGAVAKEEGALQALPYLGEVKDITALRTKKYLAELTKVAQQGPEVEIRDGEVAVHYASAQDIPGATEGKAPSDEDAKALRTFNDVAGRYAKFPYEWRYESEKPGFFERFSKERREYRSTKEAYDSAREAMLAFYGDKFAATGEKNPTEAAMLAMNRIDEHLELNQLFNTHPDAEKALLQIEDQSVLAIAAKEFWKKKGMFIAYGAAARAAAVAISGGVILPAIALLGGGVGYGIGRGEGGRMMKGRRDEGRMGAEDVREEISFDRKDAQGKVVGQGKRKAKEFTDATVLVDRMARLSDKLAQTKKPEERKLLEQKIAETLALMKEKHKRGMINFGGSSRGESDGRKGNNIANRLNFMQAMAKGEVAGTIDREKIAARMEEITGLRQAKIEEKRKQEIMRIATDAALLRAGFAVAGGAIAGEVKEFFAHSSVLGVAGGGADSMVPTGFTLSANGVIAPEDSLSPGEAVLHSDVPHFEIRGVGDVPTPEDGAVATLEHTVKSGENFSSIMKAHLGIMKDLTPAQQENVIQNFIRTLSPEELKSIGITDVNHISAGAEIDVSKLNELLLQKQINGQSLITHAEHLGAHHTPSVAGTPHEATASAKTIDWEHLSRDMKAVEATKMSAQYLDADTKKIFGTTIFDKPTLEWTSVRSQSAEQVFGNPKEALAMPANGEAIAKIRAYAIAQGITEEKGFLPAKGESVGAFLERAHMTRILTGGPRKG